MKKNLNIALCEGRHQILEAVDGAIFGNTITDVTNSQKLEDLAFSGLWNAAYRHHKTGETGFVRTAPDWDGCDMEPLCFAQELHVNLYVTGLTVALIAALNVCRHEGLTVTLWHFDRETGSYFSQGVA